MPVDPPGSRACRAPSGRGHTDVAAANSGDPPASRGRAHAALRPESCRVKQGPPKSSPQGKRVEEVDDADRRARRPADGRPDPGPLRRASLHVRRVLGVFGSFGADTEETEAQLTTEDLHDSFIDPIGDDDVAERRREGPAGPRPRAMRRRRTRGSILNMVISYSKGSSDGGGRTPSSKEGGGRQEGTNVPDTSDKKGSRPGNEGDRTVSSKTQGGRRARDQGTETLQGSRRGSLLAVVDAIKSKAGGRHLAMEDEDPPPVPASRGYCPRSTREQNKGPSRNERGGAVDASVFDRAAKGRFSKRGSLLRQETASTTAPDRGRESSDGTGAGYSRGGKTKVDGPDRVHKSDRDGSDRTDSSSRRRGRAKEGGSLRPLRGLRRGSLRAMLDAARLATLGRQGPVIEDEDVGGRPRPHRDEASGDRGRKRSSRADAGRKGEAGVTAGLGAPGDEKHPGVALDYDEKIWSILY